MMPPSFDSSAHAVDQADGLRRLFSHTRTRFVPVVSNPHIAFGGVMLERLCTGFAEHGLHTLVVDAAERANAPAEVALFDLAACIEPLSPQVSYLAARGLPLRHVDARGSTEGFLQALTDAAPRCQVMLIHAPAGDLCRLFARSHATRPVCPLLLADDRPASVTHAYGSMKLLVQRAGLMVHDLMLGAAASSPRAERIAVQLAMTADDFLGAVLREWAPLDPATDAREAPAPALRRLVRTRLCAEGDLVPFAATSRHEPLAAAQPRRVAAAPSRHGAAALNGALN